MCQNPTNTIVLLETAVKQCIATPPSLSAVLAKMKVTGLLNRLQAISQSVCGDKVSGKVEKAKNLCPLAGYHCVCESCQLFCVSTADVKLD